MSEMIERVARAIHNSEYNGDGDFHWREESADIYRRAAREAVAAMREPTLAQLSAATLSFPPWGGHGEASAPSQADMWRAMIDAAL